MFSPSHAALALGILLVFHPGPAWALDPHRALTQALLRKWQYQQGLPQPTIFRILQTSDGYIWLGTTSGLYRFDGIRFTAASEEGDPPLKNLWIQDLCEDRDHALWIATNDAGLLRLHKGTVVSFGRDEGLPALNVRCLLIARNGDLWIGTDEGLARRVADKSLEKRPGAFISYRSDQGLAANDVHALCEMPDGTICIGGAGNWLSVWDGAAFSSREVVSLPARGSIRALLAVPDGSLWIGTTTGLVHRSFGSQNGHPAGDKAGDDRRFTRANGLPDDAIDCLIRSREGSVWVGTREGFSRVQGDEVESFRTRDGLSHSTVFTICEDHEGNIWVGTKHGLNQFVDRRTMPITASEGLPGNDTGALLQDQAGAVWVGTLGKGLASYDGRRCAAAVNAAQGLPSDTVVSLADGGANGLWIGTDHGLCRFFKGKIQERFTIAEGLPSNLVTCLCRDHSGTLWAGTSAGIARLNDGRFSQPGGDYPALQLPVLALVDCGTQGLVAATTGGGLYQCIDRQFRPYANSGKTEGQIPNDVNAFHKDRDGLLWMGTRGSGLALWDVDQRERGKIARFTVKDGLYDDEVYGIVADDDDRLWMACSRGIFFVSRAELLKFAAGTISRLTSTPFSPTDAQRTIACQSGVEPAVWKMLDGRIWFSTDHGVIVVDPQHTRRVLPPPPVYVEEVQVNGQEVAPDQIPELAPGQTTSISATRP